MVRRTETFEERKKREEEQARMGGIPGIERALLTPKPEPPKPPRAVIGEGIDVKAKDIVSVGGSADVPVVQKFPDFSTVELPDGRKLFFRDGAEADKFVASELAKTQQPPGTITPQKFAEQQRLKELAGQIGQLPPGATDPNVQEAGIDYGQATTAGIMSAAPSAILGIGTAALAGTKIGAVGGPWGMAAGGALGFVYGLYKGIMGNIESQKKGEIRASVDVLSAARTNMAKLSLLARRYPERATYFVWQYNQQLAQVHRAHAQIKIETQGNLNSYIEDGTDILSDFELFLDPQIGTAKIEGDKLFLSLTNSAPISDEEFLYELNLMEFENFPE